jgi:hypothetical protein
MPSAVIGSSRNDAPSRILAVALGLFSGINSGRMPRGAVSGLTRAMTGLCYTRCRASRLLGISVMDDIDAEWSDICYAIYSGPAVWDDWIELGQPDRDHGL